MIGTAVNALAENAEPPAHGRVFPGEARPAPDVREIEDELVDGIALVLERGGYGQSFTGLEERKDNPAPCRGAVFFHQPEASPGVGGRGGNGDGRIVLALIAAA